MVRWQEEALPTQRAQQKLQSSPSNPVLLTFYQITITIQTPMNHTMKGTCINPSSPPSWSSELHIRAGKSLYEQILLAFVVLSTVSRLVTPTIREMQHQGFWACSCRNSLLSLSLVPGSCCCFSTWVNMAEKRIVSVKTTCQRLINCCLCQVYRVFCENNGLRVSCGTVQMFFFSFFCGTKPRFYFDAVLIIIMRPLI